MPEAYEVMAALLVKYVHNEATHEEIKRIRQWINIDPENKQLFDNLQDPQWVANQTQILNEPADLENAKKEIWEKINNSDNKR